MCTVKPVGNGGRKTTPSGIIFYEDTKEGHAAQVQDVNATMGSGSGEAVHPEPGGPPPPASTTEDCTTYTDKLWDTSCSKYFKFAQMKMKPETPAIACAWQNLCKEILDKIIDTKGPNFSINSAYRTPAFNASLGNSSKTSDHLSGAACDISAGSPEKNKELFKHIGKNNLPFSQLIFEGRWVHVAFNGKSPASVIVLVARGGSAPYENGGGKNGSRLPPDLKWA